MSFGFKSGLIHTWRLEFFRKLLANVILLTVQHDMYDVHELILKCSKLTDTMVIIPVKLEVPVVPVFLKRPFMLFCLGEPVHQTIQIMCEKGLIMPPSNSQTAPCLLQLH